MLKPVLTLTTYSQLKALSDPLRAEMMIRLCERPYTGQLLSEKFGISRAKIHYHLKRIRKEWSYRDCLYRRKEWHCSKVLSICR